MLKVGRYQLQKIQSSHLNLAKVTRIALVSGFSGEKEEERSDKGRQRHEGPK